jgi:hypothetical protein
MTFATSEHQTKIKFTYSAFADIEKDRPWDCESFRLPVHEIHEPPAEGEFQLPQRAVALQS